MIITIEKYRCSDSFMPDLYELKGITKGLINVAGVPTEKIELEGSQTINGKLTTRILISCKSIKNGIEIIKEKLPNNIHVKHLIKILNKKEIEGNV